MSFNIIKMYVIYDTENNIWDKVYDSFSSALIAVVTRIDLINEEYIKSADYVEETTLPGVIEPVYIEKWGSGVLVANIYDHDVEIYIKEVNF